MDPKPFLIICYGVLPFFQVKIVEPLHAYKSNETADDTEDKVLNIIFVLNKKYVIILHKHNSTHQVMHFHIVDIYISVY